ncbi:MAG: DnaA regulatory inactivator Hda [Zoogloeaceae bacterium]|jgi:DnaA family protein|nr:DnaA regulatory inactivator Hda [Zoogloeaceae bacterium]
MRQLLLDLLPEAPPSLDNFVPGGNGEAQAALRAWLGARADDPCFLLWGDTGSGKTHLLRASGLFYLDARQNPALADLPQAARDGAEDWALDNLEALDPAGQGVFFNRINRVRAEGGGRLLCAARSAPFHLALREDVRTRLGQGLIYRLEPLSDAEKLAALEAQAKERAMPFTREGLSYLLCRASRDMRTLSSLVAALDRYSLERKRPITLPLLREALAAMPESRTHATGAL